jgi:hypothetical protein
MFGRGRTVAQRPGTGVGRAGGRFGRGFFPPEWEFGDLTPEKYLLFQMFVGAFLSVLSAVMTIIMTCKNSEFQKSSKPGGWMRWGLESTNNQSWIS